MRHSYSRFRAPSPRSPTWKTLSVIPQDSVTAGGFLYDFATVSYSDVRFVGTAHAHAISAGMVPLLTRIYSMLRTQFTASSKPTSVASIRLDRIPMAPLTLGVNADR